MFEKLPLLLDFKDKRCILVITKIPYRLLTTDKLDNLPNKSHTALIKDFYNYVDKNNLSDNHKLNNPRVIIPFSNFLNSRSLFDIKNKNEILEFLDTKIKSIGDDPDVK